MPLNKHIAAFLVGAGLLGGAGAAEDSCAERSPPADVDRGEWLKAEELRHRECVAAYRRQLEVETYRSQIEQKRAERRELQNKGEGPFVNAPVSGVPPTAVAPAPLPLPEETIEGTAPKVVGTSEDRAVISDPSGRLVEVGVGEEVGGWHVRSIGAGMVQLTRKGRTVTYRLD